MARPTTPAEQTAAAGRAAKRRIEARTAEIDMSQLQGLIEDAISKAPGKSANSDNDLEVEIEQSQELATDAIAGARSAPTRVANTLRRGNAEGSGGLPLAEGSGSRPPSPPLGVPQKLDSRPPSQPIAKRAPSEPSTKVRAIPEAVDAEPSTLVRAPSGPETFGHRTPSEPAMAIPKADIEAAVDHAIDGARASNREKWLVVWLVLILIGGAFAVAMSFGVI